MKDILLGRYADHDGNLTVNSLVPLDDMPLMHPDEEDENNWRARRYPRSRLYWPLYSLGALVGHTNIVTVALKELGGKFDVPCGEEFALRSEEGVEIVDDHTLPSEMFHWIFQKNMVDMIGCLVKECGFKFRWIDHKKYISKTIFDTIFKVEDYPKPPWDGFVDEEDLLCQPDSEIKRIRGKASYELKMKMLDLLISLGFPFELFFPVEPSYLKAEKLQKEGKLRTPEERQEFEQSLSKTEKKVNERLYYATCSYNEIQRYKKDTVSMADFYENLKTRWKEGQETAQLSKLEEFEILDSRWRKQNESSSEPVFSSSDLEEEEEDWW
ncbi:hypothetical protein CTEN210_03954 [Chaetoceros tenuissimus]|uniref:Uncharacterized protein n=1 Tax=Chaetoceros tenuissimus TaxID=426638 RepID=A0AAD3H2H4_9STRA|nr:hypothetical protein CTEN210_03954 [Chaetoceros tenuissimus]